MWPVLFLGTRRVWGVGGRFLHPGLPEERFIHFVYLTVCQAKKTDGEESILQSICAHNSKCYRTFFLFLLPFKWELNVSGKHLLGKLRLENLKVSLFKELHLLSPSFLSVPWWLPLGWDFTGSEVACCILMHTDHFTALQAYILTCAYCNSCITTRYFKIPQFLKGLYRITYYIIKALCRFS